MNIITNLNLERGPTIMHVEWFLIFATLLAEPTAALPRSQDHSEPQQQNDNSSPVRDIGLATFGGIAGGGAVGGINYLINSKKTKKLESKQNEVKYAFQQFGNRTNFNHHR